MENKVSIDIYDYNDLTNTKLKYELLMTAIFDSADLDLFNELRFDLEELQKAIKVLEPFTYNETQSYLINKKRELEENGVEGND